MKTLLLSTLLLLSNKALAQVSEPVPGSGGESIICINESSSSEMYLHYVFTSKLRQNNTVEVLDYGNNYNKIQAKVVELERTSAILATEDESFVLFIDLNNKQGSLSHKGLRNYNLKCMLSGPIVLESMGE